MPVDSLYSPSTIMNKQILTARIAAFIFYTVWFFAAYLLALVLKNGVLFVNPKSETIEAIALTMFYLAPFDWLIITVLALPVILIVFRKRILRSGKTLFISSIVTGVMLGAATALFYGSTVGRVLIIRSIF